MIIRVWQISDNEWRADPESLSGTPINGIGRNKYEALGSLLYALRNTNLYKFEYSIVEGVKRPRSEDEDYLLANGWDHVMTEEDGCDSWGYSWDLRKNWPYWMKHMHGTQHFWDLDDAVELQRHIDRYKDK